MGDLINKFKVQVVKRKTERGRTQKFDQNFENKKFKSHKYY